MLMRNIVRSVKRGGLRNVLYLMISAMGILGVIPNVGNSTVIPADQASKAAGRRAQNEAKIKATLERKEIAARLSDYGLTPQEVSSRLDRLSDQQVSEFGAQIDKINAGTDAVGLLITILLIILLVWLILRILGFNDLRLAKANKNKPSK